ncbi:hypothetical protein ACFS6H_15915 [Terrimonas rubra]|uniref:HNH endonuclease n=1 Tax=Terrimonas rubra TaxID=1035890 RepID=A0ABW6AB78_9BACT
MIAIPYKIVDNTIGVFNTEIDTFIVQLVNNLNRMRSDKRLKLTREKKDYINEIISHSKDLIIAKPKKLDQYRQAFDKIITPADMASKQFESFRNRLIKELGYTTRRSDFYPKYFRKIGIKSCVYCNAHLTVAIEKVTQLRTKQKFTYKAKFQVDHYWPKSKYPCFSISLYNLYPVCGSCNNCKSFHDLEFLLYSDSKTSIISSFKFNLVPGSVANYLLSRKIEDINFTFNEPPVLPTVKKFQEVFDIQGIYDTQKDLAEELILKAEVYTAPYRLKLKKQFPKLFTTPGIFNRILLGNYSSEEDIHKRPMAKFTIDIARQVGLIKK